MSLHLLLTISGTHYAVATTRVRRLVPYVQLHSPPSFSPREFAGWLNFQGELIPVVDATIPLAGRPVEPTMITRILLVEPAEMRRGPASLIGLIAERAHRMARLEPAAFTAARGRPALTSRDPLPLLADRAVPAPLSRAPLPVLEHEGMLLHLVQIEDLCPPALREYLAAQASSSGEASPSATALLENTAAGERSAP